MIKQDYISADTPKGSSDASELHHGDDTAVLNSTSGVTPKNEAEDTKKDKLVSLTDLLSFADDTDRLLMLAGTIRAIAASMAQPLQIVLIGEVLNGMNPSDDTGSIIGKVDDVVLNYVIVVIAAMVAGFLQVACWSTTASRQVKRIRAAYMSSILTKEIGWFDVNKPMQMSSKIVEAAVKIQEGMGRKIGDGIHYFSMAVSGVVIGLIKGWDLALILLALMPFVAFTAFLSMKVLTKATQTGIEAYGQAGAVAQESLSNIRTVHMFNGCNHFLDKYKRALDVAERAGISKGFAVGWGTGIMFFTMLCTYAVGMFYGGYKVANDQLDGEQCTGAGCYDGGRVVVVFSAVLTGSMAIGQAAPSAEALVAARAAAYDVFETIRRASAIDPLSEEGKTLENVWGRIDIKDVYFAYPSRPDVQVCGNYSLSIDAGETVALVGPSGSGKSTIVSLLERFYDPLSGSVSIDGEDVRGLNVKWLRQQIGLVGQELVLFPTTIMENIRLGAPKTEHEMVRDARYWALGFVALGFVYGLPKLLQHYCFAVASERLVARIRLAAFSAMLRQNVGWFDEAENASGGLLSRLSTDAATLQAMTSESLNRWLVNITTLGIVFAVCFYFSWQMTLILLAMAPLLTISSFLVNKSVADGDSTAKKNNDADASAGALLTNAIESTRTVASLGMEKDLNTKYKQFLETSKQTDTRAGIVGGAAFGFSLGMMLLVAALLFYVNARWISNGTITFEDMFAVLMVFSLSSFSIGSAAQGATDTTKATQSARNIFAIIDRVPPIDATSSLGHIISPVQGTLEFHDVHFAYPARPDAQIHRGYNLKITPGQTVALVGASGCGKSTAIALLEHFYDPQAGSVTLDGVDLRELSLPWLRDRISLVSQEPVLFAGTIADNIALGKPGASREEVVQAAEEASALEFVRNLPDGFDTNVGDRGGQVSGGQKQRLALARAILRDLDILLLDEATSALDNASERMVQKSLDQLMARKKRTTIIVAHRLSTIRNADLIAVADNGVIVEIDSMPRRTHLSVAQKTELRQYYRAHPELTHEDLIRWAQLRFSVLLGRSTVGSILRARRDTSLNPLAKRNQEGRHPEMERALYQFVLKTPDFSDLNDQILCDKANELLQGAQTVTKSWVFRFKQRHAFQALRSLRKCIDEYEPKDVFNLDETGLYYQMLPHRKDAKLQFETRVSVGLCCNLDASEKLEPIVIHSQEQIDVDKMDSSKVPVRVYANDQAWMTRYNFEDWLQNFNLVMEGRQVLLLVDNAPCHGTQVELSNVRVYFLPPNSPEHLQPMRAGIMDQFKLQVKLKGVQWMLDQQRASACSGLPAGKMDLVTVVQLIVQSWKGVEKQTIRGCWVDTAIVSGEMADLVQQADALKKNLDTSMLDNLISLLEPNDPLTGLDYIHAEDDVADTAA
ncbi:hypothetical protein BBJ29_002959 [Phytophthora kernoviae]|uniref:HTH CENPB-type domain-containing protein n=1 Tax=Phytophthora kernoviae TaxID=325452 RepID=A0A421FRP5_9STRA|nr:hypothetical protein BBJ29_002959 [Phytophthora kernoviae]